MRVTKLHNCNPPLKTLSQAIPPTQVVNLVGLAQWKYHHPQSPGYLETLHPCSLSPTHAVDGQVVAGLAHDSSPSPAVENQQPVGPVVVVAPHHGYTHMGSHFAVRILLSYCSPNIHQREARLMWNLSTPLLAICVSPHVYPVSVTRLAVTGETQLRSCLVQQLPS